MPHCKACRDPRRDQIDEQLLAGTPLRVIVASTGLSLGGLSRHRDHLRETLALAMRERSEGERAAHGKSLVGRVEELISEAQDVCRLAKADKKYAAASNALNSVGRSLELIGKLTGEIALSANAPGIHLTLNRVTNTTINNYDNDVEFAAMIGEATRGFDFNELMRLKALVDGQSPLKALPERP